MQSQKSSKKQGRIPLPLPWGFGSMAFHGRNWWLTWRDAKGEVHYENSGTPDAAAAQKLMAQRALPRAQALLAILERVANGEETYQGNSKTRRKAAKSRKARRDRGATAADSGRGAGQEKTSGETE